MHKETKKVSRKKFPWVLIRDGLTVAFGVSRNSLWDLRLVCGGEIEKRAA